MIAAFGAAGVCGAVLARRRRQRGWNEAVSALGLRILNQSHGFWALEGGWLEADDGVVTVRLQGPRRKGEHGTGIAITVPWRTGFDSLRIRHEPLLRLKSHEVEIGDSIFDNSFSIEGPAPVVAALLDAELRDLLTRLDAASSRFEIDGAEIRARVSDEEVPHVLPLFLDVGRRFAQMEDTARRLAGNALQDPEAGVRLLNLRLLVREFPDAELTRDTARQACADPSPEVRLQAATSLATDRAAGDRGDPGPPSRSLPRPTVDGRGRRGAALAGRGRSGPAFAGFRTWRRALAGGWQDASAVLITVRTGACLPSPGCGESKERVPASACRTRSG